MDGCSVAGNKAKKAEQNAQRREVWNSCAGAHDCFLWYGEPGRWGLGCIIFDFMFDFLSLVVVAIWDSVWSAAVIAKIHSCQPHLLSNSSILVSGFPKCTSCVNPMTYWATIEWLGLPIMGVVPSSKARRHHRLQLAGPVPLYKWCQQCFSGCGLAGIWVFEDEG